MNRDTKDTHRIGTTLAFLMVSPIALYLAFYFGWASGIGPAGQPHLKVASDVAFGVMFLSLAAAVGMCLLPYLMKRRRKKSVSSARHTS